MTATITIYVVRDPKGKVVAIHTDKDRARSKGLTALRLTQKAHPEGCKGYTSAYNTRCMWEKYAETIGWTCTAEHREVEAKDISR